MSEPQITPAEPTVTPTADPAPQPATATPVEPPKADWPDDWRDKVAGDDADFRKNLDHFNSPNDIAKSWRELRKKMDSGEYKRNVEFNPDWSDEEKAQWRKESGVPDTPEGYTLPEGLVIGEEDKPLVDQFLKDMNELNLPDKAAGPILDWYFKTQAKAQADAVEADRAFQAEAEEALRAKWGAEYNANKNMAENFAVNNFGEDIGKAIMQAGPDAVEAVARIAREINPTMTVVPNASNPSQAIADEIAQLEKEIGTPAWLRDEAKQARYRQLIDARNKSG